MVAIGCLLPIVFVLAGSGIGAAVGNTAGGIWGGIGGLVLGCAAFLALLWGFEQIKQGRSP